MNAWSLRNIGDFQYIEKDIPELSQGEVLVRVKAAGICGSDIPRVYENGAHMMPIVIGHEFSGVVEAVGKDTDKKWLGKRVGIFPLIPCKKCTSCKNKKFEMCNNYNYLGSRTDGGFADFVSVPEWNLIELPSNVTFEQAAMLEPMSVAVHAMRRLSLTQEMTVAVCGLGTIGLLLIMFLKELGIKNIYSIGNKESQKKILIKLGIPEDDFCDLRNNDIDTFLNEKTNGIGVDAYFECVGKNETITQALNVVAPGGKICLIGNPYSDITFNRELYWKILRKQLKITGTWNSSFFGVDDSEAEKDDWHYVLNLLSLEKINPQILITHRFIPEELSKGFDIMRNKKEEYMKIIMTAI